MTNEEQIARLQEELVLVGAELGVLRGFVISLMGGDADGVADKRARAMAMPRAVKARAEYLAYLRGEAE